MNKPSTLEGRGALITWARDHGDERLQLMIELGTGDIVRAAERAYVDAHAPEGYSRAAYQSYPDAEERRQPTLPELVELKKMRAIDPAARAVYVPGESRPAIEVDVTCPNGTVLTVARILRGEG